MKLNINDKNNVFIKVIDLSKGNTVTIYYHELHTFFDIAKILDNSEMVQVCFNQNTELTLDNALEFVIVKEKFNSKSKL
ncbi:hypothetical protein TRFO_03249 [Tritrichomonas foetus]|uniref:Uncharacterized protein n=1 Tax=Tritrichomonas foetus TaxID=1144522 RepID=A0A1J4KSB5_9EUKA|nr:hypothetical protein TRFO_03249 [Tritrichomonas foetus]|eukprot:OHT14175.1 hypothetical protein TRFO_03249 [Tritrichomonas foetus]